MDLLTHLWFILQKRSISFCIKVDRTCGFLLTTKPHSQKFYIQLHVLQTLCCDMLNKYLRLPPALILFKNIYYYIKVKAFYGYNVIN